MENMENISEGLSPFHGSYGSIGIINYGAGNIFSLTAALNRLNISYEMISSPQDFEKHERYIIPGVGHAGAAMHKLNETGLIPEIMKLKKPVLGVCVGMQLLTRFSEEGNSDLMDIMELNTRHFPSDLKLKVPHTGWNKVHVEKENKLFNGLNNEYFYYVHSYHIEFNPNFTIASTEYGIKFSAAIMKDNFYGVQFHPEKSGKAGEQVLLNFAHL
ncbi:MAG TPA: imidazole glycerol phosphate synthase subunit HisH [Sphingobacteriaceae bacterium]|nr:imidazole glycerol phosphate synthase subunit HisH [Sphingobacteriaceae bacterium]